MVASQLALHATFLVSANRQGFLINTYKQHPCQLNIAAFAAFANLLPLCISGAIKKARLQRAFSSSQLAGSFISAAP
jgi:hypothetical protein